MKTKRINWLLIGAAALAMGACSDEEFMVEEGTENGKKLFTFEATMDADTRTTFNADYSGLNWVEGDRLSFFTDAGDQYVASSKYVDGNQFKASLSSKASGVCAIYPYNSVDTITSKGVCHVDIPFKQIQEEAGVLNGANVPMSALADLSSGVTSLKFYPLASLMAFNVYHSNDGIVDKLKSVTYSSEQDVTGAIATKLMEGHYAYFSISYWGDDFHFNRFGSVGLATPYEIPRSKSNNKSRLVYLAVNPYTYASGGTVIVTTDENKAYYFTMKQSLNLEDPYKTQTIAMDLAKADKVETLDNLNSRFSDNNFLKFLLENYDVNLDGKLSSFEVDLVKQMNCSGLSIKSLKGIELFTNLKELNCRDNELSVLDLKSNTYLDKLYCSKNKLTNLDVSGCTGLKYLSCEYNQLTSLNVNSCTKLTTLCCTKNKLTNLDVSGCTGLTELRCDVNQLTSLNVSGYTGLQYLKCFGNQLTSLDLSGCTGLKSLDCYNNQLTSLNVSGCTELTYLDYSNGTLQNLNVSGCTGLEDLNCDNNQLTSLNVSDCTGLKSLDCYNNQLTSLNVSGCTGLTTLRCWSNQLTSLDVSGCASVMTYVNATGQPKKYAEDEYGNIIVDKYGNRTLIPFKFYKAKNQTIEDLRLPDGAETIEK